MLLPELYYKYKKTYFSVLKNEENITLLLIVMTFSSVLVAGAGATANCGWEELKVVGKCSNERRGLGQGFH